MAKDKTTNLQNGVTWQPGWDYLSDMYYKETENTTLWKVINFIRRNRNIYNITKILRSVARYGPKELAKIFSANDFRHRVPLKKINRLSKAEKKIQEKAEFPRNIKISIITSIYNTNEQYLKEMINSVLAQTYKDWELCLADGSNKGYNNIKQLCLSYVKDDKRIKYSRIRNASKPAIANRALEMATGDYIGILDHNDLLHPGAIYEIVNVICNEQADFIYTDEAIFKNGKVFLKHHKPDYAKDTLYSNNYIDHFTVFSRELFNKGGRFKSEFENGYDYDLILRYTHIASNVYHIPKLLYFNRSYKKQVSDVNGKMLSAISGENVVHEHLKSCGYKVRVEKKFGFPGFYRILFELKQKPLVSIIIPNKDNILLLRNCLLSIIEKTTYTNYEIIIVENNSEKKETFAYYEDLKKYNNINIVHWQKKGFNYSEICNYGAECAKGSQLIFLNNDIMIITPNWIEEMLMYSQRDDVGIVGMKLYFLNGAIQHAGVVLGLGGVAGHIYLSAPYGEIGYMAKLHIVQNMSAVTGACMMIKKSVFEEIDFFTPTLSNSYNDIDLCLKAREKGYLIVWTPYAEAYHLESKSRGYITFSINRGDLSKEISFFRKKWEKILTKGDPYYNCNFSLDRTDYSLID